jgi:hypothetical protein
MIKKFLTLSEIMSEQSKDLKQREMRMLIRDR